MQLVLDTHTLLWYLEALPQLGAAARQAMDDPANSICIPSICFFELERLYQRGKSRISGLQAASLIRLRKAARIIPLKVLYLRSWPAQLEMHDAMIVASALFLQATQQHEQVVLLTIDRQIRDSGLVRVVW